MPRIDSSSSRERKSWPQIYTAVFLTTLATLLLELSLTRIFSVVYYYHFAFLAISIALFGLGAGGVFSYVVAGWKGQLFGKLGGLSAANSVLAAAALVFLLTRRGELGNLTLAMVYFASALPFFTAGAIVSLAISETIDRVDRVYFFDLLGAAAGCMVLIPSLNRLGGPNTVLMAAVLFAAAAAIWWNLGRMGRGRVVAVALGLALTSLVVINMRGPVIDVKFAKGMDLAGERFVRWNSFSRIAVKPDPGSPNMLSIVIDADAATGIASFDFDNLSAEDRKSLARQGPGLPYAVRPGAKTLIIGAGGGWDVARALASGSRDVTAVEINPIIANTIMRDRFAEWSKRLYFRPEVRVAVEDGRSYVRRSAEKYQVLQATLVDTWASTAAGAFALSENNLYTVDAFEDYLNHLTPDGILAFTRWGFEPPRESLRLLSLACAAFERLGVRDCAGRVLVAREGASQLQGWGAADTVLIARSPFTPACLERAARALAESGMEAVYLPGSARRGAFSEFLSAKDRRAFFDQYPYDVSPVTDNRPFFFYTVQPRDVLEFLRSASTASADYKINRAVPLLFGLVAVSIAATLIILALPPLVLGSRLPRERGVLKFLLYFAAIGAGYILIQVALIQKFVLFLGHPTYALTVIIFSMLVSSGIGSFFSRRLVAGDDRRLSLALAAVTVMVALLAAVAGPITSAGIAWRLWVKMLAAAALIAPAGFLMGMPFPSGLLRLEAWHKPSVRWAWSLNAAASVMGSAGAIFLALYVGLQATLFLGGALYLAALASVRLTPQAAR